MTKNGLSIVILTHNEKDKIGRTLASIRSIADQIIIVDDCSDESFRNLCKKLAPKSEIYMRKLDDFATQKNFGISKVKYEWILNLDADEEVSPQLGNEIKDVVMSSPPYDAFNIKFTTVLFGKFLENNERHVRLFRNNGIKFENSVHEVLKINGKIGQLKWDIIHHHWNGYADWFQKLDKYAYQGALRDIRNGKNYSRPGIMARMVLIPFVNFLDGYLVKKRYKLGFAGFVHSVVGATNAIRRFAIYYEIKFENAKLFRNEFGRDLHDD